MSIQQDDQESNGVALPFSADAAYVLDNIHIVPQDPYAIDAWNAAFFFGASTGFVDADETKTFDKCSRSRLADQLGLEPALSLETQVPCWADSLGLSESDVSPLQMQMQMQMQMQISPQASASCSTDVAQPTLSPPLLDDTTHSKPTHNKPTHNELTHNDNGACTAHHVPRPRRHMRKQNHACDPCRASKKACTHDAVRRHYSNMTVLIALWRTTFGTIDSSAKGCLQSSHRDIWRLFAFCAIDTDLCILLFLDAAMTLESNLQQLPPTSSEDAAGLISTLQSTRAYRAEQRLVSARQVATISSTCQDGSQDQPTYGRYMCAHPSPWMMVQSHSLAVQVFSEEVQHTVGMSPPDVDRVFELTADLTTCLHGMRALQESLYSAPLSKDPYP